jgi:hypothetical protein
MLNSEHRLPGGSGSHARQALASPDRCCRDLLPRTVNINFKPNSDTGAGSCHGLQFMGLVLVRTDANPEGGISRSMNCQCVIIIIYSFVISNN